MGLCLVLNSSLQIKQALRERFGVRSYPAALVFTDMGQDPFVYKLAGELALNFSQIAAMHRWPLVPPLQVDTVEPLGCSWGPGVNYKLLTQACAVLVRLPLLKSLYRLSKTHKSVMPPAYFGYSDTGMSVGFGNGWALS